MTVAFDENVQERDCTVIFLFIFCLFVIFLFIYLFICYRFIYLFIIFFYLYGRKGCNSINS